MLVRCENSNHTRYQRYGGRGITVCEAWHEFSKFLADMGERPIGTILDRIDKGGNYEPGNCRWATRKEQYANHPNKPLHKPHTQCKYGHALEGDNLIKVGKYVRCKECHRRHSKEYQERQKKRCVLIRVLF
jgi:hypothetical protein